MAELTLKRYLISMNISVQSLSTEIGVTRQCIYKWMKEGATVDLVDAGIKIRSGKIVYETPG